MRDIHNVAPLLRHNTEAVHSGNVNLTAATSTANLATLTAAGAVFALAGTA